MSQVLLKSVGLDNWNAGNDPANNLWYRAVDFHETDTPWVRFNCDFVQLAPFAPGSGGLVDPATDNRSPGGGAWTPAQYVSYMDSQIKLARSAGLKIVLTCYRYPYWMNGTADTLSFPYDSYLTPQSYWAQYIAYLMVRYSSLNPGAAQQNMYVEMLEVMNEPNLRPGQVNKAAQMMVSAEYVRNAYGITSPILAGPAVTDNDTWDTFTTDLLNRLDVLGFHGGAGRWAWTMHNYLDIGDLAPHPTHAPETTRAQAMRQKLVNHGWAGWPFGSSQEPYVSIAHTEGGGNSSDRNSKVVNAYSLWRSDTYGRGLLMFTQFLDVSNPNWNTGMREYNNPPTYSKRTLYNAWAALTHA